MMSLLRQRPHHAILVWTVLAGLLYRGLIPVGFMPVRDAGAAGVHLAICTAGTLLKRADRSEPAQKSDAHQSQCPFALAAMASVPPAVPMLWIAEHLVGEDLSPSAIDAAVDKRRSTHPPARAPPLIS